MNKKYQKHLIKADSKFKKLIQKVGHVKMKAQPSKEAYRALVRSVVYQQLSGKAAAKIFERFVGLFGVDFPTPHQVIQKTVEELRLAGLSRSKAETILRIALEAHEGRIPDAQGIKKMSDLEIIECLTKIKGVGPWTVQMFLMFTLKRPDVMPVTDYGVRKGYQKFLNKRKLPSPKQLEKDTQHWAPYRSYAAWYMWRLLDD
ncbi:MAG: DNA-3-methyladenine glycosylase [Bdellovibrionales bacterium]